MNINGVNLNLLVALEALLDERSVTRAAQRLGLSQPAASHALGQLRTLYGDALLIRGADGMARTPLGDALLPATRATLREVRALLGARLSFDPTTSTRTFRIAASDYLAMVALDRLLVWLNHEAPGVALVIKPWREGSADALEAGEIDALLASPEQLMQAPGVQIQRLFFEEFSCLLRKQHPAVRRGLDLDTYCAAAHALVATDEQPGHVDRRLERRGRSRRITLRLPDFAGLGPVLTASDLVATVPARVAAKLAEIYPLRALEPPLPLGRFPIVMAWHQRHATEPASAWLRTGITAAARAL